MSLAGVGAPPHRSRIHPAQWAVIGGGVALGIGAAATIDVTPAAAVAVLVVVASATALRPATIVMLLVASIFLEVIALGGVTISRLVAPLALLVVVIQWLRRRASMKFAL